MGKVLHRLAGMHVEALSQGGGHVHLLRAALQHAVRDEYQPVSHLQLQRLNPIAASGLQPERAVGLQSELRDLPSSQPERRR